MLELVRALTATRSQRTEKGTVGRAGARPTSAQPANDLNVLRRRLADLVGPIDPADAEATKRVRRPLFQAIVLWEFGEDFRRDPEFSPMLDAIERAFDADTRMPGRLAALIRDLRR